MKKVSFSTLLVIIINIPENETEKKGKLVEMKGFLRCKE